MTRDRKFSILLFAASAVFAAAVPARAQVTAAPAIKTKAKSVQTQETKPTKTRFQVLHMMNTAIQVQSLVNEREIHTFTYADPIRDQMQKLLDQGGYQFGDKVVIQYKPGTEVALKIKGKPSKPI
jgi:D-alanyl-D-alanine carboxypeptidase